MKKILLVEDSPTQAIFFEDVLLDLGCEVQIARDGAEALTLLQNGVFDGIVTDYEMPFMDGLALIQASAALGNPRPTLIHSTRVDFTDGTLVQEVNSHYSHAYGARKCTGNISATAQYLKDFVSSL